MNCSADNPKTLVNAHDLSQTLVQHTDENACIGKTPVTAHQANPVNCNSDNPKTFINARKRS